MREQLHHETYWEIPGRTSYLTEPWAMKAEKCFPLGRHDPARHGWPSWPLIPWQRWRPSTSLSFLWCLSAVSNSATEWKLQLHYFFNVSNLNSLKMLFTVEVNMILKKNWFFYIFVSIIQHVSCSFCIVLGQSGFLKVYCLYTLENVWKLMMTDPFSSNHMWKKHWLQ